MLNKTLNQQKEFLVFLSIYFVFLGLALLPIWLNQYLPLQDYANHLARMHIINNIQIDPYLQKFYTVKFDIIPNLAMDFIIPVLSKVFPLEITGKIMVSLTIVTLTSGCLFLNYALFKQFSFVSFLSFLFVFNEAFIKGFINFVFGIGVVFWCIGIWILISERKPWVRILLFNLLCSILFFCHLFAIGVYSIVVIVYEIANIFPKKNIKQSILELIVVLTQFITPAILYLNSPTSSSKLKLDFSLATIYKKILIYPLTLLSPYKPTLNRITICVLIAIIIFEFCRKRIIFNKAFLLPILLLIFIYFIIPGNLSTGANTDWRLLLPIVILFISSINFSPKYKLFNPVISIILVLVFLTHTSTVTYKWLSYQSEYREIVNLVEKIEVGSRLFHIRGFSQFIDDCYSFGYAPTYAVIKKSAFVPSLFAFETQQPLRFNTNSISVIEYKDSLVCPRYVGFIYQNVDWQTLLNQYDYLLLGKEEILPNLPKTMISKVSEGKNNILYKKGAN